MSPWFVRSVVHRNTDILATRFPGRSNRVYSVQLDDDEEASEASGQATTVTESSFISFPFHVQNPESITPFGIPTSSMLREQN